ncbi:leucine zipper domain-containing protein [Sphingomonas floccifaciens]|uniref:Leucine zipper domain-containing protein n=1 Tax=Sphingomonas floccifaciens TaxID=1844115 RepID=A0ABW4NH55_9SPHN
MPETRPFVEPRLSGASSCRTVAKWLARYRAEGRAGLLDRSPRPRRMPRATSADVRDQVIDAGKTLRAVNDQRLKPG